MCSQLAGANGIFSACVQDGWGFFSPANPQSKNREASDLELITPTIPYFEDGLPVSK